jgi:uridine kinase
MWPEVTEVEEKYIEPFRTKVDYYVDTTQEYELGVYKGEVAKFIAEGKIKEEEVPFFSFLELVDDIPKDLIPDTSLMWEFVDKDQK